MSYFCLSSFALGSAHKKFEGPLFNPFFQTADGNYVNAFKNSILFFFQAISRVDSRPKLERYLKRFCRRLVCCEYFLSLTPVPSPCPDDCKADRKFEFK